MRTLTASRQLARLRGLGDGCAALPAACGACERHAGAELRAGRRAPPGRAACGRGDPAPALCGRRAEAGMSGRDSCAPRLRATRSARASACAWGRSTSCRAGIRAQPWRVLRRSGCGGGIATRRRTSRACARHRRHAVGGTDGGAIRRDGQAHARRPLGAERALRRAARRERVHRHRECVRERIWRVLHDVLAFARPLQSERADVRVSASAWRRCGVALKFYSCVGTNHTSLDAIRADAGAAAVRRLTISSASSCRARRRRSNTPAGPIKPEGMTSAQLNLPFCVATLLLEGDVFVDQFRDDMVADPRAWRWRERWR